MNTSLVENSSTMSPGAYPARGGATVGGGAGAALAPAPARGAGLPAPAAPTTLIQSRRVISSLMAHSLPARATDTRQCSRAIHLPVRRVPLVEELVERHERRLRRLADRAELERLPRHGLHPARHFVRRRRDLGRAGRRGIPVVPHGSPRPA